MSADEKPVVRRPTQDPDLLSAESHRLIVGGLGALLPPVAWLVAGLRPTEGIPDPWALLEAVSAYYWTGAVSVFVGVLFALSLLLLTYRGYRKEADPWVASVGGVAGLVVALVPTVPPGAVEHPTWWHTNQGTVHFVAATLLFGALALFCLWLFRKSNIEPASARPLEKRVRNAIFLVCGIVILVCMLLAWQPWHQEKGPIFWPETGAIEAFAFSWLVKSGVHERVARAVERRFGAPSTAPGE